VVDINLIPREYRERKEGLKGFFSKATIVILVLVFLSLLFYGGLLFYKNKLAKNLESIANELELLNEKRDPATEQAMVDLDKRITILKTLFEGHFYYSAVFEKLEELTIPEVYFSSAKAEFSANSLGLNLLGNTSSYTNLARQILSFQEDLLVGKVKVSGIALDDKGKLRFNLLVDFYRDILLKEQAND